MSCWVVTGDFFADEFVPVPRLARTMSHETPPPSQKCMCASREFLTRSEGPGIQTRPFTLRVVCRTQKAWDGISKVEEKYKEEYRNSKMDRLAQRRMFFKLKSFCDCELTPTSSPIKTFSQSSSSSSSRLARPTIVAFMSDNHSQQDDHDPSSGRRPNRTSSSNQGNGPKIVPTSIFQETALACALAKLTQKDRAAIINREIANQIRESVDHTHGDNTTGSIYWIVSSSNPGYLRIGCSPDRKDAGDIERNARYCLKDAKLVGLKSRLPNVHQIMYLVTAELQFHARNLNCKHCATRHKIWYEVDVDVVDGIVSRWAAWMRSSPYESKTGYLKAYWLDRSKLDKIDQLMPAAVARTDNDNETWGWWTRL